MGHTRRSVGHTPRVPPVTIVLGSPKVYTDSRVSRVRSTYCTAKFVSFETEIGLKVRADTCGRRRQQGTEHNSSVLPLRQKYCNHSSPPSSTIAGCTTHNIMNRTLFPAPIMITGKSDVQCAESKKSKALEELAPFEEQFVYACSWHSPHVGDGDTTTMYKPTKHVVGVGSHYPTKRARAAAVCPLKHVSATSSLQRANQSCGAAHHKGVTQTRHRQCDSWPESRKKGNKYLSDGHL